MNSKRDNTGKSRRAKDARSHKGFALVVTLSLMILLTIMAVGLLSLSTVALRTTSQSAASATARNNARLALMQALNELQVTLGPDRGVSAAASSVVSDAKQPHLTGVWESWRRPAGGEAAPDYGDKASKFRRWLVSAKDVEQVKEIGFASSSKEPGDEFVELVGEGENGQGQETQVVAEKVLVSGTQQGKMAWAVFDESLKAPIDLGDPDPPLTNTLEPVTRTAPSRVRADLVDTGRLGALRDEKNEMLDKVYSLETAGFVVGKGNQSEIRRRFHDFTTGSVGLLTDTANGGLKTDLTSLFEEETAGLPGDVLYSTAQNGAPTWSYLRDHYRKYKNVTNAAGGTPTYKLNDTDLTINPIGQTATPVNERLLPVIAKCQIVFSIVAHHAHFPGRVDFHNRNGTPTANNERFAVPHLVYEPVFTIHNPYDVALNMDGLRIRIWDPPVKFHFSKNTKPMTPPRTNETPGWASFTAGSFITLGQMQAPKENDAAARKAFTFILTDGSPAVSGNSLKLLPGEVKVFSARVEEDWTWGMEIASGTPRSFFDYQYDENRQNVNFGNIDNRTAGGIGRFGVEAVPGWDTRAGLQTDHLSNTRTRPTQTLYDFERPPRQPGEWWAGYVSTRLTDEVRVEAKPEIVAGAPFRVDILAGKNQGTIKLDVASSNVDEDLLRRFSFTFRNVLQELVEDPRRATITREYVIEDILQKPGEKLAAGKKPFAILEASARTTRDPLTDNKPWLYTNHILEGADQNHARIGLSHQSYDVRFREMLGSFNDFPGIEVDPDTDRGFFGASTSQVEGGSSFVTMARVPLAPAASLGELTSANLIAGSMLPRIVHPFGNSRAHPLIAPDSISQRVSGVGNLLDHSYLLNESLWDSYYFSSVCDYEDGVFSSGSSRDRKNVLTGIFDGTRPALNSRLVPVTGVGEPKKIADEIDGLSANERAVQLAKYLGVRGPFNLNSTSVDAWRAVLSALRDRPLTGWGHQDHESTGRTPFARAALPVAGAAEGTTDPASTLSNNARWAGFRALDDDQIKELAENIVEQITLRGSEDGAPPLSVGEFVNRRVGNGLHAQAGLLQTAIDETDLNEVNEKYDSIVVNSANVNGTRKRGLENDAAMNGFSGEGAPSSLTQADLLAALAPIATVRGDTFKIRGYGEALAADGTTVLASAMCEAVVQRIPDYVDSADEPETPLGDLTSDANRTFGRRFEIVSFRWLASNEI